MIISKLNQYCLTVAVPVRLPLALYVYPPTPRFVSKINSSIPSIPLLRVLQLAFKGFISCP